MDAPFASASLKAKYLMTQAYVNSSEFAEFNEHLPYTAAADEHARLFETIKASLNDALAEAMSNGTVDAKKLNGILNRRRNRRGAAVNAEFTDIDYICNFRFDWSDSHRSISQPLGDQVARWAYE